MIQPWTEDPRAATDARKATTVETPGQAFVASLAGMQSFSAALLKQLPALQGKLSRNMLRQLSFLGEDNISNPSAVRNLQAMARKHTYVNFGSRTGLEALLPGVTVRVLGPPNLEQSQEIRKQRPSDAAEYWHLQAGGITHEHLQSVSSPQPRYITSATSRRTRAGSFVTCSGCEESSFWGSCARWIRK